MRDVTLDPGFTGAASAMPWLYRGAHYNISKGVLAQCGEGPRIEAFPHPRRLYFLTRVPLVSFCP